MLCKRVSIQQMLHIWSRRDRSVVLYQQFDLSGIETKIIQKPYLTLELQETNNIISAYVEGDLHIIQTTVRVNEFEKQNIFFLKKKRVFPHKTMWLLSWLIYVKI